MLIYVGGLIGYLVILFAFFLAFRYVWEKFLRTWLNDEKPEPTAEVKEEDKHSQG